MTPALIRSSIVAERVAWVRQMLSQARGLPLSSFEIFLEDSRNAGAAESYLRRSIEALLDIGRHILVKGFAIAVCEYKEIGTRLVENGVLDAEDGILMRRNAGYRNRMVHFYNEVTIKELFIITTQHINDIDRICDAMVHWIREHPEMIDHSI